MAGKLAGRRIAFLVANEGVEQIELVDPWQAIEQDGGQPVLLAPDPGKVHAFNHLDRAAVFPIHQTVDEVAVEDFAGLVLPGGVANPDQLRTRPGAVALVRAFVDAGKPVAAICHAPWTLIEARPSSCCSGPRLVSTVWMRLTGTTRQVRSSQPSSV